MNIYEIDAAIASLIDEETGEIADYKQFEGLQMARENKIENMACWYKNLIAEGKAIKAEEDKLKKRREACENKAERLKTYLGTILHGEKFQTARAVISYRKTDATEIEPEFVEWAKTNAPNLLAYKEPTANKTAIKEAIKAGEKVKYASLVKNENMNIK